MKAIVWDDLLIEADRSFYDDLSEILASHNVDLVVEDNWKAFLQTFRQGRFSFALIDCYERENLVGPGNARELRKIVSSAGGRFSDPEFPIFLLSRDINSVPLDDWDSIRAVPIKKDHGDVVAGKLMETLDSMGRWIAAGTLFVIHRQVEISVTGTQLSGNQELITAWAEAAGFVCFCSKAW